MEGGHHGDRDTGREMGRELNVGKGPCSTGIYNATYGTANVIFKDMTNAQVPLRPFPFNERALCNTSERNIVGLHLAVQWRACITNLPAKYLKGHQSANLNLQSYTNIIAVRWPFQQCAVTHSQDCTYYVAAL